MLFKVSFAAREHRDRLHEEVEDSRGCSWPEPRPSAGRGRGRPRGGVFTVYAVVSWHSLDDTACAPTCGACWYTSRFEAMTHPEPARRRTVPPPAAGREGGIGARGPCRSRTVDDREELGLSPPRSRTARPGAGCAQPGGRPEMSRWTGLASTRPSTSCSTPPAIDAAVDEGLLLGDQRFMRTLRMLQVVATAAVVAVTGAALLVQNTVHAESDNPRHRRPEGFRSWRRSHRVRALTKVARRSSSRGGAWRCGGGLFDDSPVTDFISVADQELVLVTPPHAPDTVPVTVVTDDGAPSRPRAATPSSRRHDHSSGARRGFSRLRSSSRWHRGHDLGPRLLGATKV